MRRRSSESAASLAANTAVATNGTETLSGFSCKSTGILYGSGSAPDGSVVLMFLSNAPAGLVTTPLVQSGSNTMAPIEVCNITATPISITGLGYHAYALRP